MPNDTMPLAESCIELLAQGFADLLGDPSDGAVAFCRCLKNEVVSALSIAPAFNIRDWQIFVVSNESNPAARQISSDHAVELREDKGPSVLLLIDTERAGAGMDGIYSAAREITEDLLFDRCRQLARHKMDSQAFAFAESAIKRARQVGSGKAVSRWQEFEFLANASASGSAQ